MVHKKSVYKKNKNINVKNKNKKTKKNGKKKLIGGTKLGEENPLNPLNPLINPSNPSNPLIIKPQVISKPKSIEEIGKEVNQGDDIESIIADITGILKTDYEFKTGINDENLNALKLEMKEYINELNELNK